MPKAALAVEIAVQDLEGVRIALGEGADRVELCSALGVGGLTPSPGMIELAAELARQAARPDFVNVLVRPRAGGFVYSADETEIVLRDIRQLRELGAGGVVVGVLDERGRVDLETVAALREAAGPLILTYHRAIDVAAHPADAVARLAGSGVDRILTSGGAQHAVDGVATLRDFAQRAAGRIEIIAGGGVRTADVPTLAATGIGAVHLSARRTVNGTPSGPGGGHPEYEVTDAEVVRTAVAAARSLGE
jgi:copper homeostasis protein